MAWALGGPLQAAGSLVRFHAQPIQATGGHRGHLDTGAHLGHVATTISMSLLCEGQHTDVVQGAGCTYGGQFDMHVSACRAGVRGTCSCCIAGSSNVQLGVLWGHKPGCYMCSRRPAAALLHVRTLADSACGCAAWCVVLSVPQLLEFSRIVLEDLSNYDPTAAWPVALDEFVEHIRRSAKK